MVSELFHDADYDDERRDETDTAFVQKTLERERDRGDALIHLLRQGKKATKIWAKMRDNMQIINRQQGHCDGATWGSNAYVRLQLAVKVQNIMQQACSLAHDNICARRHDC